MFAIFILFQTLTPSGHTGPMRTKKQFANNKTKRKENLNVSRSDISRWLVNSIRSSGRTVHHTRHTHTTENQMYRYKRTGKQDLHFFEKKVVFYVLYLT